MKEKVFTLFFLLSPFLVPSYSQGWELNIKSPDDEALYDAIEDKNGDYLLCGHIGNGPFDPKAYDGYLVKVSPSGSVILSQRISSNGGRLFLGTPIEQADGYLVFGTLIPASGLAQTLAVFKFDFNLVEQWRRIYGQIKYNTEQVQNAIVDDQNNIIAIGTASGSSGNAFFIYRFDSSGQSLKGHYFDYSPMDLTFDILQTDSGYKVFSEFFGSKILNLDSTFAVLSTVPVDTFPTSPYIINFWRFNIKAKWLNDSVYIAYARVHNLEYFTQSGDKGMGVGVLWFTKNDSIIQSRIFGKSDTMDVECNKGGLDFLYKSHIYAGSASEYDWNYPGFPSFSGKPSWYNLNRFDESGNIAWQKWYGGDANYYLPKVLATRDSGCLMVGTRFEQGVNVGKERDIYILKVDPNGHYVPLSVEEDPGHPECKIYPNPTSSAFTIQLPNNRSRKVAIEIYNTMGEEVFSIANPNFPVATKIDFSTQPKGIYFIKAISGENVYTGKVVVQ